LTLLHATFGANVFFFHSTQVALHITNTILIFLLFRKFLAAKLSFFLALLFLIHPINTEAVSYISAVSDPLFVLLGLGAFHVMLKDKLSWFQLFLACVLILLSLLTKEAGFLLLPLIVLYRLLFRRGEYVKTGLFILIPTALYFYLRFAVAHTFFAKAVDFAPIASAPLSERLITIPKIIFFYIWTFFVPARLSIAQHWVVQSPTFQDFYLPLIADMLFIGVLLYVSWQIHKRNRKAFLSFVFFLIWFCITLGLYVQLFPLDMTVAERWFYLPMIGLLGMFGLGAHSIQVKNGYLKTVGFVGFIMILSLFSIRTLVRNTNWATPYTLFSHDVQITPESFDLQNNYSTELMRRNQYDAALIHTKKAIALNPRYSPAWATAGNIYLLKKDYKTGISALRKALDLDGGNYVAFYNLIYGSLLSGDYASAKGWSENALRSFPNQPELVLFLAIAEYKVGNTARAFALAKQAHELNPTAQSQHIYSVIQNNQPLTIE
jgi:tetratricopeptide (TPR) repeat protein